MADTLVVALYDDLGAAQRAADALTLAGASRHDIGIIANNAEGRYDERASGKLGAMAIPGIGPVLATGILAATVSGTASGGLVGGLVAAGIAESEAWIYAEGLRRGGVLLAARVDEAAATVALESLDRHGSVDLDVRRASWSAGGWRAFDPRGEPWNLAKIKAERVAGDADRRIGGGTGCQVWAASTNGAAVPPATKKADLPADTAATPQRPRGRSYIAAADGNLRTAIDRAAAGDKPLELESNPEPRGTVSPSR